VSGASKLRAISNQWILRRKIAVNESVEKGSMLQYIKKAQAEPHNWNVMLLNPNYNRCATTKELIAGE
jgi:hypothetical protein